MNLKLLKWNIKLTISCLFFHFQYIIIHRKTLIYITWLNHVNKISFCWFIHVNATRLHNWCHDSVSNNKFFDACHFISRKYVCVVNVKEENMHTWRAQHSTAQYTSNMQNTIMTDFIAHFFFFFVFWQKIWKLKNISYSQNVYSLLLWKSGFWYTEYRCRLRYLYLCRTEMFILPFFFHSSEK